MNDHINTLEFFPTKDASTGVGEQKDFRKKQVFETELALSDKNSVGDIDFSSINISSEGLMVERWSHSADIPSVILEHTAQHVVLDCLVDKDNMIYQQRKLERRQLEGIVPIEVGSLVLIKQRGRPGRMQHDFENGSNIISSHYFDYVDDPFKDVDLSFSKKF